MGDLELTDMGLKLMDLALELTEDGDLELTDPGLELTEDGDLELTADSHTGLQPRRKKETRKLKHQRTWALVDSGLTLGFMALGDPALVAMEPTLAMEAL